MIELDLVTLDEVEKRGLELTGICTRCHKNLDKEEKFLWTLEGQHFSEVLCRKCASSYLYYIKDITKKALKELNPNSMNFIKE